MKKVGTVEEKRKQIKEEKQRARETPNEEDDPEARAERKKKREENAAAEDSDGEERNWLKVEEIPKRFSYLVLRRVINSAGGKVVSGKTFWRADPPVAVAEIATAEEAKELAEKIDGEKVDGVAIACRAITQKMAEALDPNA